MSLVTSHTIDALIRKAVFDQGDSQSNARQTLYSLAKSHHIELSSTHFLYRAFAQRKLPLFSVPAINMRTLTYDFARRVFGLIKKYDIGIVIFEIAASEQEYSFQTPEEYTVSVIAAALVEEYEGPIFLQGDHYQARKNIFSTDKQREIDRLKNLIRDSIKAGFYNIDIDASTLVNLELASVDLQQKDNYETTALLTRYIREIEKGEKISIGGEIGHIGGVNSIIEDFYAFMKGYKKNVGDSEGISKIAVQTGSSHGGTLQADGSLTNVAIDFNILKDIGRAAQEKYGLGGAVQHGASTLDKSNFDQFPLNHTVEVHLATDFQNIFFDHLDRDLKNAIYTWVDRHLSHEKKPELTQEQFMYKNRKKALGSFKKEIWSMPEQYKQDILNSFEAEFKMICDKLNICNTRRSISPYI